MISVTSFFRDTENFKTLEEVAIAEIVKNKRGTNSPIRVWSAGCSTGEEAYTLCMLFIEEFERQEFWPSLKIFATDVNQQNVDFAAIGSYSQSVAAEINPQRLERFFDVRNEKFNVKNDVRQCIVFARHNLLTDPPFTKMDLVVCRNTLIYFKNSAQEQALYRLQYAVNPNSYLFLGSSETLQASCENFKIVHAKHKLFQRLDHTQMRSYEMFKNVSGAYRNSSLTAPSSLAKTKITESTMVDSAASILLANYAPPALVVNSNHEVVHFFGNVDPYVSFREGVASLSLGKMLPAKLTPIATALLYKAAKSECKLLSDVIHFTNKDNIASLIRLSASPISSKLAEKFLLLCFETVIEQRNKDSNETIAPFNVANETIERIEILEYELAATRESLQSTIEELETSNEELQATNEELMSSNEELQSSNEELQSVNEELNTVNSEYQEKAIILSQLNADLDSMAKASGIATIFVDEDLQLTRFSRAAVDIFKIRDTDLGRRLDDFAHNLNYPNLIEDIEETLHLNCLTEKEVTAIDKSIYLMRILPYAIPSSIKHGAVATFVDITASHNSKRLQFIIDALPETIAVLNQDGTIALVNEAWRRFATVNGGNHCNDMWVGANYLTICNAGSTDSNDFGQQAYRGIKTVLEGRVPIFSLEYSCDSPTEKRWFVMNVAPINQYGYGAVVSHVNISFWRNTNQAF